MTNPWLVKTPGFPNCQTFCAADRTEIVRKETDAAKLQTIIDWPDTQRTVRAAAERRLRRLGKRDCGRCDHDASCQQYGKACRSVSRDECFRHTTIGACRPATGDCP